MQLAFTYEDNGLFMCPECAHQSSADASAASAEAGRCYRDSAGNVLQDGDTVTVVKDLEPKGFTEGRRSGHQGRRTWASSTATTTSIVKIDGFGAMSLKSRFVEKFSRKQGSSGSRIAGSPFPRTMTAKEYVQALLLERHCPGMPR